MEPTKRKRARKAKPPVRLPVNSKPPFRLPVKSKSRSSKDSKLLSMFPEEIWLLILENIKDAQSLYRIHNSATLFRRLLHHKITHIMFPSVAAILYKLDTRHRYFPRRWNTSKLLPLRFVCHTWRDAVDSFLQTPDYHQLPAREQLEKRQLYRMDVEAKYQPFDFMSDFTEFHDQFRATHWENQTNPFVTRGIIIGVPNEDLAEVQEFYDELQNVLKRFGHHVWYCVLQSYFGAEQPGQQVQFYLQKLPEILEAMPNLKSLACNNRYVDDFSEEEHLTLWQFDSPALPKLLEFSQCGMPEMILDMFLQNNPQIKGVDVHSMDRNFTVYLKKMANLEQIAVEVTPERWEELKETPILGKIKKLRADCKELAGDVEWVEIFKELARKFGDTLENLWIHLAKDTESLERIPLLRLPNLKTLQLKFGSEMSLDFIMPLQDNLEELTVILEQVPGEIEEGEKKSYFINFFEYGKKLWKSNIWQQFPKLKIVKKCTKEGDKWNWISCTREEWEAHGR